MGALETIRVVGEFPVRPEVIYAAWLDARQHTLFTGGKATIEPRVGGRHTAWDGYIQGETLSLLPGRRIVQTWRSDDFPDGAADSRLEISFEKTARGARVTILHSNIPSGQGGLYEEGWNDHYFEPMKKYFQEGAFPEPATVPSPARNAPVIQRRPATAPVRPQPAANAPVQLVKTPPTPTPTPVAPVKKPAPATKKPPAATKKPAAKVKKPAAKKAKPAAKKARPAAKKARPAVKKARPAAAKKAKPAKRR